MVVCKPTYEMVFGLSGLTHVILKGSKTIPVISGSIGLNFTVPESTPKEQGPKGPTRKALTGLMNGFLKENQVVTTNVAPTISFQELLLFVWESIRFYQLTWIVLPNTQTPISF